MTLNTNDNRPINKTVVTVPREFVTQPFFTATKQTKPRSLLIAGRPWTIGVNRLDGRGEKCRLAGLDIRHGRLCFALLSFRDRLDERLQIRFSVNELAHRFAASNGGRYSRDLVELLFDLFDTWIRIDHADGTEEEFRVVENVRVFKKPVRRKDALAALKGQREFWLDNVSLNENFFRLLDRYAGIRLDVLTGMRSTTAQAIYTYIPSRAIHHDAASPFEITLTNLMTQIDLKVPSAKSKRREVFTRRQPSILDQLDGAELIVGKLRVSIAETADGNDYKLQAWLERPRAKVIPIDATNGSAVLALWREHGGTKRTFDERLKHRPPLALHHADLIERAGASVQGNEAFYTMAAALIGQGPFERILHEAKSDHLEGDRAWNPGGRLAYRLKEAIKIAAGRS